MLFGERNESLFDIQNDEILFCYAYLRASQVALLVKNPPASVGDVGDEGSIPGWGRSPEVGLGNPLQCSCLVNPQGQRSPAGYGPQGCKESHTTEAT